MAAAKLTPTRAQYLAFDKMFSYFNRKLFAGELRACVLTFSRKSNAKGFFAPERWTDGAKPVEGTEKGRATHEIALNPDLLAVRTPEETASTLVHEMVHLWQQDHGKPSRGGYHNHEWAAKMIAVGLQPSHTGEPGGKVVGAKMTHFVITGGPFAKAFAKMPADWFLPFVSGVAIRLGPAGAVAAKKRASKTKYTCRGCKTNLWAKPDVRVECSECGREFEVSP